MLRACRRLLRRSGRMAFHVIIATPGLTPAQRREAARSGPPALLTRGDHTTLLHDAGFPDVEETDLTADYRTSLCHLLEWSAAHQRDLRAALGDQLFAQRQDDRRVQLAGVDGGLLRRSMFVAHAG